MPTNKIISFDSILKESKDKKNGKKTNLYENTNEYWDKIQKGESYSFFVNRFRDNMSNSSLPSHLALLHELTDMNVELLEQNKKYMDDEYVKKNGYDHTMFAYADFYTWCAENILNKPEICELLGFNFNGDLPIVLQFGEKVHKDLVSISNAHDYDEMDKDYPCRMFADAIIDYMDSKMEQFCIMAFVGNDENESFVSDKIAFMSRDAFNSSEESEQSFDDIRETMLTYYKSNIIQLLESGGRILMVYLGNDKIFASGFGFDVDEDEVTCSVMDESDFVGLVDEIAELSNETGDFDEIMPTLACAEFEVAELNLDIPE